MALAARFGTAHQGGAEARPRRCTGSPIPASRRKAADLPQQLNLHERKFLELARALAARPRLLLLDEVMSGLNHTEIDAALRLMHDIRDSGTTILFVEHLMRAVVALSDRVAVAQRGRADRAGHAARDDARRRGHQRLSGQSPCCLRSADLAVGYGGAPAITDIALDVPPARSSP